MQIKEAAGTAGDFCFYFFFVSSPLSSAPRIVARG